MDDVDGTPVLHTYSVVIPCLNGEQVLPRQLRALAAQNWDENPWPALTNALKEATGRKGKALFLPLRQALTGHDHGPEMAALLPLIGREAAIGRLHAAAG